MGRPVWRDVLEQISSGRPSEPLCWLPSRANSGEPMSSGAESRPRRPPDGSGTPQASPPVYPADLAIVADADGRPEIFSLAAPDDSSRRGDLDRPLRRRRRRDRRRRSRTVAWESTSRRSSSGPRLRSDGIHSRGTALCSTRLVRCRAALEWITRFWCAKEAAAKATGLVTSAGTLDCEITQVDEASGVMRVKLGRTHHGRAPGADDTTPCASFRPAEATMPGPGPLLEGADS